VRIATFDTISKVAIDVVGVGQLVMDSAATTAAAEADAATSPAAPAADAQSDAAAPALQTTVSSPAPPFGLTKEKASRILQGFLNRTKNSAEADGVRLLAQHEWVLENAVDAWEGEEKERTAAVDDFGLGMTTKELGASLWSWGSKAAGAATKLATDAAAAVDTEDLARKAKAAAGQAKCQAVSLNSYFDEAFLGEGAGGDAGAAAAAREEKSAASRAASADAELHRLFPDVPPEEVCIESFGCVLRQTYTCALNAYTPDIPVGFKGTLFVSSSYACFYLDSFLHDKQHKVPITMPFASIGSIQKGKSGDIIRVVVMVEPEDEEDAEEGEMEEEDLRFSEFADDETFEAALGLLEQKFEDSAPLEDEDCLEEEAA